MEKIKNIIICGLGGIGSLCASIISRSKENELKILVDKSRYERYKNQSTYFNGQSYNFDYILPDHKNFKADLIIISTKDDGLEEAIDNVQNFVDENTIFISFLNGIHSEEKIAKKYGWQNTLISFYIGHSCIRKGREIIQDGEYKFIIGLKEAFTSKIALDLVKDFFTKNKINYEISNNITDEYWKKFFINVGINQLSAVKGLSLKQIKKDNNLVSDLLALMQEAQEVAKHSGIKRHKEIYMQAKNFLLEELEDAFPSMLQDIKANRKTEVDIFAGEIMRRGKLYGIKTPLNEKIYKEIKEIESEI